MNRELLSVLKACRQDADRFTRLKPVLVTSRFTVAQLAQLVVLFSSGDGKVQVSLLVHPRLADPERFGEALPTMYKFPEDVAEIKTKLGL